MTFRTVQFADQIEFEDIEIFTLLYFVNIVLLGLKSSKKKQSGLYQGVK